MKEREFATIAALMARTLRQRDDESALNQVRNDVAALCNDFNPYATFTK
jgi:glycine/serine hydroxymethyltransferase